MGEGGRNEEVASFFLKKKKNRIEFNENGE